MSTPTESQPAFNDRVPRTRLPALPPTKTLQKRPLLHPPISSPSSSEPKVFYVSGSSSHAAIIKRVNKQLDAFAAASTAFRGKGHKRQKVEKKTRQTVSLKAAGRGITNAIVLGTKFMDMGCEVRVTTGSIKIVDDIVDAPEEVMSSGKETVGTNERDREDEEEADMQVRTNSTVEVTIWRKDVGK